jgi:hypothetical protein
MRKLDMRIVIQQKSDVSLFKTLVMAESTRLVGWRVGSLPISD